MTETDKQIEEAKRRLADAGFAVTIGGCGCCGSPWVRITYHGDEVIYTTTTDGRTIERSNAGFRMHEGSE